MAPPVISVQGALMGVAKPALYRRRRFCAEEGSFDSPGPLGRFTRSWFGGEQSAVVRLDRGRVALDQGLPGRPRGVWVNQGP